MNTLLWFFIIVGGLGFLFTLLAPYIARFLLRWLNKKAAQSMEEQTRTYRKHAENNSPFEDNFYYDKEMKVTVPKKYPGKKKNDLGEEAKEVDFEDVE